MRQEKNPSTVSTPTAILLWNEGHLWGTDKVDIHIHLLAILCFHVVRDFFLGELELPQFFDYRPTPHMNHHYSCQSRHHDGVPHIAWNLLFVSVLYLNRVELVRISFFWSCSWLALE